MQIKDRLGILLLIASLALFVLRLIGEAARARQLEFHFQSNTRRSRPVLSVIRLGLQVVRKNLAVFSRHEVKAVIERMRYDYPALGV